MFEVKIEKELFDKLFEHVMLKNDNNEYFKGYVQIFPKDETLFQYSKNFKKFGSCDGIDPEGKKIHIFGSIVNILKIMKKSKIYYMILFLFIHKIYTLFLNLKQKKKHFILN